ncbi:hypothetical protein [Streptomyces sp. NPDC020742]|uniref:hypothetical protein n=1 Tax=unclassified Streptomyces TaxID=2593676 RepID=UPI0033F26B50
MKSARSAAVALLSAAALGVAAPAARARVDPDPVAAGQRVSISDGRQCASSWGARAASPLFGAVVLRPGAHGMAADARVAVRAEPGRYPVTIECAPGGATFTETVTVRGGEIEGIGMAQAAGGLALLVLAGGAGYLLRRRGAAARS